MQLQHIGLAIGLAPILHYRHHGGEYFHHGEVVISPW